MRIDENQIRQWYGVMMAGNLCEIRILTKDTPDGRKGATYSGLFDDCESIINALRAFPDSGEVKGVYYGLNVPLDECRKKRQYGRIIRAYPGECISATEIARRRWILVDIDPVRAEGHNKESASEQEKAQALATGNEILKLYDLELPGDNYFPNPKIIIDSGNGYHLLWRCDLPNDAESDKTINTFLQTLKRVYNNGKIDMDTSVSDAPRISKLPGTWARKGEDSPERPHRLARILQVIPDNQCDAVTLDDLKAVIDHFKPKEESVKETAQNVPERPENADKRAILQDVESCLRQLEERGIKFPSNREMWHAILCGWYHTLGADGLDSFLRFSAMWENADAVEDRAKYLEIEKYPHAEGDKAPATIQKFFELCKTVGVAPAYNWRQWQVDITQVPPAPVPIIERNGRIFLSRQNLCTLVGRPKAGKTTLLSAIVATAYTGRDYLGFSSNGNFKTVWIDTEQAPDDSARVWRGVYNLAGIPVENNDALTFLRLLETPVKERIKCIEAVVKETRPDLVILDGIGDIVKNTNDIEESQAVVTEIRRINSVYDCGFVVILHVNWRDEKARGHLGTILQHKSENVALLEHTAGMDSPVKVTPQLTRKAPYSEFTFGIDADTGQPVLMDAPAQMAPAIEILLGCILAGHTYRHKDLVSMMQERGVSESNAKKYIGEAVKKGYLLKLGEGYAKDDGDIPI